MNIKENILLVYKYTTSVNIYYNEKNSCIMSRFDENLPGCKPRGIFREGSKKGDALSRKALHQI